MLEEQLVDLVVQAMEKSELENDLIDENATSLLTWQHLSSQLIYFVVVHFASFAHMVTALNEKVKFASLVVDCLSLFFL